MKPEIDTEMPLAAPFATSDGKTDLIEGELETPRKSLFLWQDCENKDQRDRVDIKQQAVFDAMRLEDTIADKYRKWCENQATESPELAEWVKTFEQVKREYRIHPGPTVGLLGVLGAGKTSLINALLGQEGLLAPSSDRAATAVPCEVAYNHESPDYRAEIIYRTRESLIDELDKLFDNLKWKAEHETRMETLEGNLDDNDSNGSEIETLNDIIVGIQEEIRPTVDMVKEIWGVDEDDLRTLSTQEVLETKSYGVEFLGTTKYISGTEKKDFAEELSSYLKPSSEDDTGSDLPLCPLIKKVNVYIKSPLLKYGLRLMDLPGLGDISEARSSIARKNSKDLDITVIVAQALRASEESTAINLIKGKQRIQMEMDGKFNRGSFCVVLSKTDDIEKPEYYLNQLRAAKTNNHIQSKLCRCKELDASLVEASSRKLKSKTQIPRQPSVISDDTAELEETQREAAAIKDWLEHTAVFMRTRDITERFQDKFRNRHRDTALTDNTEPHESLEVFGVSNKAYWMSKHPDGVKALGFPNENHSGIPRLRQWLFETTFTAREDHLDAILCKLWGLLIDLQDLAALESENSQTATKADTEELVKIHDCFAQELTGLLKQSGMDISRIGPLREKDSAIIESRRQCGYIVERWGYKYPENKNEPQRMHFHVQTCILRKEGESYKIKQTSNPHTYHWIDNLTAPYYDTILESWNQAFQRVVPAYEHKIMELAEPAWQKYGTMLARLLIQWPGAKLEHDSRIQDAIEVGKILMRDDIRRILKSLTTNAAYVHPVFRKEVKEWMIPAFREAREIKGTGAKAKRDKILRTYINQFSAKIFRVSSRKTEAALLRHLRKTARDLEELAGPNVAQVEKLVKPLFGLRKAVGSPASENATRQFLKENGHVLASWKACWQNPSSQRDDHVMRGDMNIPEPLGLFNAENDAQAPVTGVEI